MSLIIILMLIGAALIFFEVIVPGGVLGLLGGVAILAACVLAFVNHGPGVGLVVLAITGVILTITLYLQFRVLPKTKMGEKLFLRSQLSGRTGLAAEREQLVGKTCEALTTLAPTGLVMLDGQKYEAFSQSGLIEKGTRLQVVDCDTFRLKVTQL